MGDAWTALSNDDEMTLFYNPASLGGNKTVSFHPLIAKIGAVNALDELDRFEDFPSGDAPAIVDRLLGFPAYIEASTYPGLKMLSFGFNLFASSKFSLNLRNRVHPSIEIDYRYDRGFITGFAFNLLGSNLKGGDSKIGNGQRLSVGYGLKYIRREGLKDRFDVFSTSILSKIENASDIEDFKEVFGFAEGKGFGHDLGFEYANGNGRTEFLAGLSILDVGGTRFKKLSGTADVPMQEMSVNGGLAVRQDFTIFDYALALDVKPMNQPIPISRMWHLGAMVNIPFFSFYGGFSEGYLNYGAEVRLWPIRITVGFYSVELATDYKEEEGSRAVIQLSFFDADFDVF